MSATEEGGGAGEEGEAGDPAGVCVMISLLYIRVTRGERCVQTGPGQTEGRPARRRHGEERGGAELRCELVGWSLRRGALATYGDSLGTGVDVKAGGWRMEDRGARKHWPSTPASSVVLKENFHSQMFATQS